MACCMQGLARIFLYVGPSSVPPDRILMYDYNEGFDVSDNEKPYPTKGYRDFNQDVSEINKAVVYD
jgi:hypothetical protein